MRPDWGGTGRHRTAARGGAVLLEAIIALVIVTISGLAASVAVRQAFDSAERAETADTDMLNASAFVGAVTLWARSDLDQRLGSRREGHWRLQIARPSSSLYLIVLRDSTGTRTLVRTSVYRPSPAGAL